MKKNFQNYFIFLFLIIIALYKKINSQSYICNANDSNNLKVGDTAYLCIHVLNSNVRVVLPVEVDEYSVVSIKGIYNQIANENKTIQFLSQMGETTSVFPAVRMIFYNFYFNSIIIIIKKYIICLIL